MEIDPTFLAASPLGVGGWRPDVTWAEPQDAALLVAQLGEHADIVADPHITYPLIGELVRNPAIVAAVTAVLGPDIAVEGGFLMTKLPGADFTVPWHQDGTNGRMELHPVRAVTLWAALTDAPVEAGGLEVIPGSWQHGYLPSRREAVPGGHRGRALTTDVPSGSPDPVPVPVAAGRALLMDVRLLHRSGPNRTARPRVGLNVRYVAPGAVIHRDGATPASLFPVAGTAGDPHFDQKESA